MEEPERGKELLEICRTLISEASSESGSYVFGIQRVLMHAMQGDIEPALESLRRTIDDGWRKTWWIYLLIDPGLDSIRDNPEFQAMVQEIEDEMAAQRDTLRAWEAAGKLEPIPDAD